LEAGEHGKRLFYDEIHLGREKITERRGKDLTQRAQRLSTEDTEKKAQEGGLKPPLH
jgi:hypothetical protein